MPGDFSDFIDIAGSAASPSSISPATILTAPMVIADILSMFGVRPKTFDPTQSVLDRIQQIYQGQGDSSNLPPRGYVENPFSNLFTAQGLSEFTKQGQTQNSLPNILSYYTPEAYREQLGLDPSGSEDAKTGTFHRTTREIDSRPAIDFNSPSSVPGNFSFVPASFLNNFTATYPGQTTRSTGDMASFNTTPIEQLFPSLYNTSNTSKPEDEIFPAAQAQNQLPIVGTNFQPDSNPGPGTPPQLPGIPSQSGFDNFNNQDQAQQKKNDQNLPKQQQQQQPQQNPFDFMFQPSFNFPSGNGAAATYAPQNSDYGGQQLSSIQPGLSSMSANAFNQAGKGQLGNQQQSGQPGQQFGQEQQPLGMSDLWSNYLKF